MVPLFYLATAHPSARRREYLLVLSPPIPSALVFPKPVPLRRAALALRLTRPFPTALSPFRSPEKTDAEGTGDDKR